MVRQQLGIKSGLAVLAALGLCLQVGLVRVWRDERAASLEAQLGELRRDHLRSQARLSRQLRSARRQSQRLRAGLVRRAALAASLQEQLAQARADASALEERAASASRLLQSEPPALDIRIAAAEPGVLLALAENPGPHGVRILESRGRLWVGDREAPVGAASPHLALAPDDELDFFEFLIPKRRDAQAAESQVRGVLCSVYERSLEAVAAEFAREIWFEYRPELGGAAVVQQVQWAPWPDELACDLTHVRPWWQAQLSASR